MEIILCVSVANHLPLCKFTDGRAEDRAAGEKGGKEERDKIRGENLNGTPLWQIENPVNCLKGIDTYNFHSEFGKKYASIKTFFFPQTDSLTSPARLERREQCGLSAAAAAKGGDF